MIEKKKWLRLALVTAFAGAAVGGTAGDALACGGFFCSRTPVDQTAERIIFTINDDDTVTAIIQISYQGDRDNFAWVVPVPGPVEPEVFPQRALTALDLATEPAYFTNSCYLARGVSGSAPVPEAADSVGAQDAGAVMVIQEQVFGPFQSVTLAGSDPAKLVKWLQDNGYRITDGMVPYIEQYVDDGLAFFAMKLLPEAAVEDISPIKIRYAGQEPMIPIRLTTVASQPEMGIVTWVLGNTKYAPKNYVDLKIADELIEFDPYGYGRNNYLTVVSKEVDRVGGQAIVTEYAAPTGPLADTVAQGFVPDFIEGAQEAQDELVALLRSRQYITRMYTRMSAEEMTKDPFFVPAADNTDISREHTLQCDEGSSVSCDCDDGSVGVRNCGAPGFGWYGGCECGTPDGAPAPTMPADSFSCDVLPPSPCAFTYCGRFGSCVANDAAQPVCVCDSGTTARPRSTTAGELQLYCEPLAFNFVTVVPDPELSPDAGPVFGDPCLDFDCGEHGACTTMNGSPTCQCESGYGATVTTVFDGNGNASPEINCEAVQGLVPALPLLPDVGETEIPPGAVPRVPGESMAMVTMPGTPVDTATPGMTTMMNADPTTTTPASGTNDSVAQSGGCSVAPARGASSAWWLGVAGVLMGLRRRRLGGVRRPS